jgi:hypothetical protein
MINFEEFAEISGCRPLGQTVEDKEMTDLEHTPEKRELKQAV